MYRGKYINFDGNSSIRLEPHFQLQSHLQKSGWRLTFTSGSTDHQLITAFLVQAVLALRLFERIYTCRIGAVDDLNAQGKRGNMDRGSEKDNDGHEAKGSLAV